MNRDEMIKKVVKILNNDDIDKREIVRHICTFETCEALENSTKKKVTAEHLVREYFGILSLDISDKSRRKNMVTARWVMFLYFKSKGLSLTTIGDKFKRDHVTVLSGIRQFKNLFQSNDSYIKRAVRNMPEIFTPEVMKLIN